MQPPPSSGEFFFQQWDDRFALSERPLALESTMSLIESLLEEGFSEEELLAFGSTLFQDEITLPETEPEPDQESDLPF
jgi:hypothetical protein